MEPEYQNPPSENIYIKTLFTTCRETLDQHYDRKERVVKQSRDITGLSKKLIFLAHRANPKTLNSILEEAVTKKKEILELFQLISCELEGVNYYRYHKNISPAIQEYIEAVSFLGYLEHNRLLSRDEIESNFKDQSGKQYLHVLVEDYILGIADLTGELMRYAINCVGKGDHSRALQVCQFLRNLKNDCDLLKISGRSILAKKYEAVKMNLTKVEDEYPKEFYQHIVSEHARGQETMEVDE